MDYKTYKTASSIQPNDTPISEETIRSIYAAMQKHIEAALTGFLPPLSPIEPSLTVNHLLAASVGGRLHSIGEDGELVIVSYAIPQKVLFFFPEREMGFICDLPNWRLGWRRET